MLPLPDHCMEVVTTLLPLAKYEYEELLQDPTGGAPMHCTVM